MQMNFTLRFLVLLTFFGLLANENILAQTSPVSLGQPLDQLRRAGTITLGTDPFRVQDMGGGKWLLSTERAGEYQARITAQGKDSVVTRILAEWTGLDSSYRFVMYQWYESKAKDLSLAPGLVRDPVMETQLARTYPGRLARVAVFSTPDKLKREVLVFFATDEGAYFSHLQQLFGS